MRLIITTGTIAVSELGGPIRPSPFGPIQPSAPIIQVIESTSPVSVSSISARVRVNSTRSAAIRSSAIPMSGPIPSSVAFLYSSSMITGDRLLTRNGPLIRDSQLADPPFSVYNPLVRPCCSAGCWR